LSLAPSHRKCSKEVVAVTELGRISLSDEVEEPAREPHQTPVRVQDLGRPPGGLKLFGYLP